MNQASAAVTPPEARRSIPIWLWWLPLLGLGLSAPLWLHRVEPTWMLHINGWCRPLPDTLWTGFSLLGNAWGLLALTAPLLLWAPRQMWAWLCSAPFAVLFARLGKGFVDSPRPAAEIANEQLRIVGDVLYSASMPSGHTLTAFAVASALYFSLAPAKRWRRAGWLWLLAAATGVSRIAVGAHWPGDVAVGLCLGIWAGLLGNWLLGRVPAAWHNVRHTALRCVAALVAVAVYMLLADPLDFQENHLLQRCLAAFAVCWVLVFVWRTVAPPSDH